MTTLSHLYRPTYSTTPTAIQPRQRTRRPTERSATAAVLKAALLGGGEMALFLGPALLPLPAHFAALMTLVAALALVVISLATGTLAVVLSGESITCTRQGGQIGWLAGFWAAIFVALIALVLAANGLLLADFGHNLVALRSLAQLAWLGPVMSPQLLALTGRVLGALLVYGLIGSLLSALISALGGMAWTKLRLP